MQARAYGKERREYTFSRTCTAPPEAVYDTVADLRGHLDWGGRRQWRMFRLLALSAPDGAGVVGTKFTSEGTIPMTRGRWEDESEVTAADRPAVFEVTTRGRIRWPKRPHAQGLLVHRYEIARHRGGSRVTYRVRQLEFREPPWGLRYPVLRSVTARVWVPMWFARGFRNLVRLSEQRARAEAGPTRQAASQSAPR
jgi:hypothetical protein